MPVHFFAEFISNRLELGTLAYAAAALIGTTFVRGWAKGKKNVWERDLHGRVVLLSGGLSGIGLVVLHELASRGAQVVALTPDLRSPETQQLIRAVRDATSNELVYAEQCDMASLLSVAEFCERWNKAPEPRRVDTVCFCPEGPGGVAADEAGYVVGEGRKETRDEGVELHHGLDVLSRFLLLNALLPSLLLLPPDRNIRILHVISPFYAASAAASSAPGASSFDPSDLDWRTRPWPRWEPWRAAGASATESLLLNRELQRRLDVLAAADKRPVETIAPGISEEMIDGSRRSDPDGVPRPRQRPRQSQSPAQGREANIVSLAVCPGFCRSTFLAPLFAPSLTRSPPLSALLWLITLLAWPLIWLVTKSPSDAAQTVLFAMCAPMDRSLSSRTAVGTDGKAVDAVGGGGGGVGKTGGGGDASRGGVRGGECYRECDLIRPPLPPDAIANAEYGKRLWAAEEKFVEAALERTKRREEELIGQAMKEGECGTAAAVEADAGGRREA